MAENQFPEFENLKLRLNNFPDDESVIGFCERFNLIPTRDYAATYASCTKCSAPMTPMNDNSMKIGWRLRCLNENCGSYCNPLQGTCFERLHLSWVQVMDLIFCFVCRGMPTLEFACNIVGCTPKTAVDWWVFMRKVCRFHVNHANKIGFSTAEIEIDETHLYRPKYHRGRGLGDVWVVGGICRETKEVFVVRVNDRSQSTLDKIIHDRVEPGSIIFTDGWRGYAGMVDRLGQYDGVTGIGGHFVCNHQVGYVSDDVNIPSLNNTPGVLRVNTNTIERLWRDLKATIKSTQENRDIHGNVHRMADTYIERYMYFRNIIRNIHENGARFRRFLEDMRALYPFNAAACFQQAHFSSNTLSVPSISLDSDTDIDSDTEIDSNTEINSDTEIEFDNNFDSEVCN